MDELLAADELAAAQRDAEYRRLVAEQAALRRLAMLVTRGVEPSEVFDAVANEMRRCVSADTAGLWRYESNNEMTQLAAAEHSGAAASGVARGHPKPRSTAALSGGWCNAPGRPARMDSYESSTGSLATRVR